MEGTGIAPPPPTPAQERDVGENRLVAALGWLWALSVVILLVRKDSPFVQFHARQGFLLFVVSAFLWFVLGVLFGSAAWGLQWLLQLLVFVIIVVGFVQALRGRRWEMPLLGKHAAKIHF